jgi:Vps16, N-terminal region
MTNPFDDSVSDTPVVRSGVIANNPFEDDVGTSINPFNTDFDDETGDNPADDDDDTFDEDDLVMPAGAPVEASWQYLGDLPYRRVPIYANVSWGNGKDGENSNDSMLNHGLSAFPKAALQRHPDMLSPRELRELLSTSTITKVVGCPYGGPIAAVTLPIVGETSWFSQTEIRIMTNAGRRLANVQFPPPGVESKYTPADIIAIGFTDRTALVVVLKDSLCLTYDLKGDPVLPPFHILPRGEGQGIDVFQATVFEGGAAVLSTSKHSAIFELLDDHDDPSYLSTAHIAARKILPTNVQVPDAFGGGKGDSLPPFCGLVTYLPTAAFAR